MDSKLILNDDHLPIPTSATEVTPEWLSKALKLKTIPKDFVIEPNLGVGTGYVSNLIRVEYKEEEEEERKLAIVKLLPTNDSMSFSVLLMPFKMDQVEILTYTKLLPAITKQSPELQLDSNLCAHLYSNFGPCRSEANNEEYASVLVLEDLKASNYRMLDFFKEFMNRNQLESVLEFLAKFHAASKALELSLNPHCEGKECGKLKRLSEIFKFLKFAPELAKNSPFYQLLPDGLNQIDSLLEKRALTSKKSAIVRQQIKKLLPYSNHIVDKVIYEQKKNTIGPWKCIIHGDLWPNNIMWNLNGAGGDRFKIIDWQLTSYADSTCDLAMIIFYSLNPRAESFSKDLIDELVKFYYNQFVKNIVMVNTSSSITTIPAEEEFVNHFYSQGIPFVFFWLVLSYEPFLKDLDGLAILLEFLEIELNATKLIMDMVNV